MAEVPEVVYWIDEPAWVEIKGESCRCQFRSGRRLFELRGNLTTLLRSLENASKAYSASMPSPDSAGKIVEFRGRGA